MIRRGQSLPGSPKPWQLYELARAGGGFYVFDPRTRNWTPLPELTEAMNALRVELGEALEALENAAPESAQAGRCRARLAVLGRHLDAYVEEEPG